MAYQNVQIPILSIDILYFFIQKRIDYFIRSVYKKSFLMTFYRNKGL